MTRRRDTKRQLEQVGADPAKGDSEGTPSEDRWFGGGSHGWFDRLVARFRGTPWSK